MLWAIFRKSPLTVRIELIGSNFGPDNRTYRSRPISLNPIVKLKEATIDLATTHNDPRKQGIEGSTDTIKSDHPSQFVELGQTTISINLIQQSLNAGHSAQFNSNYVVFF